MSDKWKPLEEYRERVMSELLTVRMVDGGFYWIETMTGWVVAKYDCGYFYEPGKDHSTTPLAISGPLTPPPNNTTKP